MNNVYALWWDYSFLSNISLQEYLLLCAFCLACFFLTLFVLAIITKVFSAPSGHPYYWMVDQKEDRETQAEKRKSVRQKLEAKRLGRIETILLDSGAVEMPKPTIIARIRRGFYGRVLPGPIV